VFKCWTCSSAWRSGHIQYSEVLALVDCSSIPSAATTAWAISSLPGINCMQAKVSCCCQLFIVFCAVFCLLWGVLTCNSSVSDDLPGAECLRTNGTALLNSSVEDRQMRQFIALGPLMVCCVCHVPLLFD